MSMTRFSLALLWYVASAAAMCEEEAPGRDYDGSSGSSA